MITKDEGVDLTASIPNDTTEAVVHAIRLAPSGGNSQPWHIEKTPGKINVYINWSATSEMDVHFKGSHTAIGVALFNARVAAAYHGQHVKVAVFPEGDVSDLIFSIEFIEGEADSYLASLYKWVIHRVTNRHVGLPMEGSATDGGSGWSRPIDDDTVTMLCQGVAAQGAQLHIVGDRPGISDIADILAKSDRIRYLTRRLHREMFEELPPVGEPAATGIDPRTLALPVHDLPKLDALRDWRVMERLLRLADEGMEVGQVLGVTTRDRVNASSAVAVITIDGNSPADYVRGGQALGWFWTLLTRLGIGPQPISPVFLYAEDFGDLAKQSPRFCGELAELQRQFGEVIGLQPSQRCVLVLRISHDVPEVDYRSRRLSEQYVLRGGQA